MKKYLLLISFSLGCLPKPTLNRNIRESNKRPNESINQDDSNQVLDDGTLIDPSPKPPEDPSRPIDDKPQIPNTPDENVFLFFGDQGTGKSDQYNTAIAMKKACDKEGCKFALGAGDNIYENGVSSVDDYKFQNSFEEPMKSFSIPMYMVLGNHDNRGSNNAQISYTQKADSGRCLGDTTR